MENLLGRVFESAGIVEGGALEVVVEIYARALVPEWLSSWTEFDTTQW